jgi:SAM-dependent methyltransferase
MQQYRVMIQEHNAKAAAVWNSGGKEYERISAHLADAIEHAVVRLNPKPGERMLDVATGTGFAARRLAAWGAQVVGIDLGADLIEAAKALAPSIDFRVADAESLPFERASFDAVLSTFGVMFVSRPQAAAAELARICRPGGRMGLVVWTPESSVAKKFALMARYTPPSKGPSPFDWGRREVAQSLLAGFDLRFEPGVTTLRLPDSQAAWDMFVAGYGPTKALVAGLDAGRREEMRRDWLAYYDQYKTELGIAVPREYLLIFGIRKV